MIGADGAVGQVRVGDSCRSRENSYTPYDLDGVVLARALARAWGACVR